MSQKRFVLTTDFEEERESSLFAIHTSIEGFSLAFQFNKHLNAYFVNVPETSDPELAASCFNRFVWEPTTPENRWELIANKSFLEVKEEKNSLFQEKKKTVTHYLIQSMTQVDFWLKTPDHSLQNNQLMQLQSLNAIQLIYPIKEKKIKLNQNLIFD